VGCSEILCECMCKMEFMGNTERNFQIWVCKNPGCGKIITIKELTKEEAERIKECPRVNGHC